MPLSATRRLSEMRPETAFFEVVNEVTTGEADTDADLTTEAGDGSQVIVSGVIPAGSDVLHTGYFAPDPAGFARALFIEALQRAGVEVTAPLAANNTPLPGDDSYTDEAQVAALESPSASQLSFLIDKISHNRGAETLMCLLAVEQGSRDCEDGLGPILETIKKAEIDPSAVFLVDGEGSDPNSATPRAMVQWLTWMNEQPWAGAAPGFASRDRRQRQDPDQEWYECCRRADDGSPPHVHRGTSRVPRRPTTDVSSPSRST